MSELEILFSAAAPASSVSAAEKAAKKAPPKQEKVHLVCLFYIFGQVLNIAILMRLLL
jgi:hypothetical protein